MFEPVFEKNLTCRGRSKETTTLCYLNPSKVKMVQSVQGASLAHNSKWHAFMQETHSRISEFFKRLSKHKGHWKQVLPGGEEIVMHRHYTPKLTATIKIQKMDKIRIRSCPYSICNKANEHPKSTSL